MSNMLADEYQKLASRTIDKKLYTKDMVYHSLFGMTGELGELHSIFQKEYQGHTIDTIHIEKELGDLLWFIAEFCTANGWSLGDVMEINIAKLKERYPNGFEVEKSLHRAEGDI